VKWAKEREAFGRRIADFGLIKEKLGEMAVRIYAAESMCYRTAGMIDECVEGLDQGAPEAGKQILKALEQYAIECSVIKVVGTELLDFVSDETVQIYGGYGFSSDYPIERAYRDQRVNRIFEGTNEINRLLITDMLIKRSMKGELGLIPAAQRLTGDILGPPSLDEPFEDGFLAAERQLVAGAKKVVLLVAGSAVQKYMQALAEEQEVIGVLSNLVMDVYGMESALLRTQKKAKRVSNGAEGAESAATRCFIYEATDRMETEARCALARIAEGDELRAQFGVLRRFLRRTPPDIIGLKRQVANRAIELGRYPFV
jgi:hypothetical protein